MTPSASTDSTGIVHAIGNPFGIPLEVWTAVIFVVCMLIAFGLMATDHLQRDRKSFVGTLKGRKRVRSRRRS